MIIFIIRLKIEKRTILIQYSVVELLQLLSFDIILACIFQDHGMQGHRTKQTVLKCSNIKHFKDVDNEFHKRNLTTLMESNDQKRRRESQIDKGYHFILIRTLHPY